MFLALIKLFYKITMLFQNMLVCNKMFLPWNKHKQFLRDYFDKINMISEILQNKMMLIQTLIKQMLFLLIYNKINRKFNYYNQSGQLINPIIS